MKCSRFRTRIPDLLDGRNFTDEERRHLDECPACAAELRAATEALDTVTPRCPIRSSEALRDRILRAAEAAEYARGGSRLGHLLGTCAAAAAILAGALLLTVRTPAHAARKHFGSAVAAMNDLKTLRIALRIRTKPCEPFTYTDPRLSPVSCTATVEYGDTLRWRIEKAGRIALCDGETVRTWLPQSGEGWCTAAANYRLAEEFDLLLDLQGLLLAEQALATRTAGAKYEIAEAGDTVRLTVTMPAQGDFRQSDYLLNSSIAESNTLREYRFDKASGRLLDLRITALLPGGERVVLAESTDIRYDAPVDRAALTACPENIVWRDPSAPLPGMRLFGLSAEAAAKSILRALEKWDEALLDEALHYYGPGARAYIEENYRGLTPVAVGKAVRSGRYPGLLVPCEVRLANGGTEKLMLALRNDNPAQCWLVDGGL